MNQWDAFAEFCRWEMAVGGPDPHMATAGWIVQGESLEQRLWMGGCYTAVYNAPGAQAIWANWSPRSVLEHPDHLQDWLTVHWKGLPLRRERKAVRSPEKLARCLVSYAEWMQGAGRGWMRSAVGTPYDRYDVAWDDAMENLYGHGRYITLKLLEFLRRYCAAPIELVGIRAPGGWSPKEALALLWPEFAHQLKRPWGDSAESNALAEDLAAWTQAKLKLEYGLDVGWYALQALSCDYKQSWVGKRQYPGRSLDSEIGYARQVEEHWDADLTRFWQARQALFPYAALGEHNGWDGVRKELGHLLRDTGTTWSDLRFDYPATADLSVPTAQGFTLEPPRAILTPA